MIAVAIISVLTTLAVISFKRVSSRARSAEVYGMLGELRTKEEAYRAEYSVYCNTQSTCATTASESTFYPALVTQEPKLKPVSSATWPAAWTALGISTSKSALYCGYVVVAGCGSASGASCAGFTAGANGAALFGGTQPTGAWWYATGTCDQDGVPGTNTIYETPMNTATVTVLNEGQ
ncbi:MAG: hypothetical protein ABI321_14080 [Polyangia bacterium]